MPTPAEPKTRRHVLAGIGLAVTCLTCPPRTWAQPAPLPPGDGFRILRARMAMAALRGQGRPPMPIWGFDGAVPGPPLRVQRGEELRVRFVNELPEASAIHWHGVRLPNAMDGVFHLTQVPVAPGASFDYQFRPPDSGTFLYRSTFATGAKAVHQLSGVLIVEEPEPPEIDRDAMLVFQNWPLGADGTVDSSGGAAHLTVNGAPSFDVTVRRHERLRLRLVNASEARVIALRLDGHAAAVMAIDGQPAEPFLARDSRVVLGPGNRIDLFVDATLAGGASAPVLVDVGGGSSSASTALARIVYESGTSVRPAPLPPPRPLPANPLPERLDFKAALKLDLPIDAVTAAPVAAHERAPAFTVRRGRAVMLGLVNRTDVPHAVHLHGHHCRLLDRLDDGWKPFWLDTVLVDARQTARIAFLADNPGKWLVQIQAIDRPGATADVWFEVT